MDRGPGQHGQVLGPQGGQTAAAARLQQPDLLPRLLPHRGLALSRHGELQRGGAARVQAREVPAPPARELRPVPEVCKLRQVVHVHRQGQPP